MRLFLLVLVLILTTLQSYSQVHSTSLTSNPEIIMHDTTAAPGTFALTIDANNFTGSNGQVSAISLNINIDTWLIEYVNIKNMTIPGQWIGNYNTFQNEITISYVAPVGVGYDIDGKLLDLEIEYMGGFDTELEFKPTCEISNVNLQTIQNVYYDTGYVEQIDANIIAKQDTISSRKDSTFLMPIIVGGTDLDSLTGINLRIGYDTIVTYSDIIDASLTGPNVNNDNDILTITWEDIFNPVNLTTLDTLFFLEFVLNGDTNSSTRYFNGSILKNNERIVATDFFNGLVKAENPVFLLNSPDTAGTSLGEGYYHIGDSVEVTAIPEDGFYFDSWTRQDSLLSTDSIYSFTANRGNDTLTANYLPHAYNVDLIVLPTLSGFVSGDGTYLYGDTVTITAIPAQGYVFIGWFNNGQLVSDDNDYTFSAGKAMTKLNDKKISK